MGPDNTPTTAGLMGSNTVEQLLQNVCLLLASRTRDVVKSALGFIKVAAVAMDVTLLAKHVHLVVSVLSLRASAASFQLHVSLSNGRSFQHPG